MTTIDQIESLGRIADDLELQHTLAPYAKTIRQTATLIEQQAKEIEELKGMNQRQSAGIGRLEEENKELRELRDNLLDAQDALKVAFDELDKSPITFNEVMQRIVKTNDIEQENKELREALEWALQEATAERDWGTAEWEQYHKAKALSRPKAEPIDPVCIIHGKKASEHDCLYCCLCFKSITPEECNINKDGVKENVCIECAKAEVSP